MTLETIRLVAALEIYDSPHTTRILLILGTLAGKRNQPIKDVERVALFDFLVRNPQVLRQCYINLDREPFALESSEHSTIFHHFQPTRFYPFDPRYRRWVALLRARGLVSTSSIGKSSSIQLTEHGRTAFARAIEEAPLRRQFELAEISRRAFASFGVERLKQNIRLAAQVVTDHQLVTEEDGPS